jgi:hypothetical protein
MGDVRGARVHSDHGVCANSDMMTTETIPVDRKGTVMYEEIRERQKSRSRIWLVTLVAGSISCHLIEVLERQTAWRGVHHG